MRAVKIEYEEFESIQDLFMYLSAAAPPMKNTLPVNSYKGYVSSLIPLGSSAEVCLMLFSAGSLEPGIYELDVNKKEYKKVESVERADRNYFVCLTPKRNTIADEAISRI